MQRSNSNKRMEPSSTNSRRSLKLHNQTHQEVNFCPSKTKESGANAHRGKAPPLPLPPGAKARTLNSERGHQTSQSQAQFNRTSMSHNIPELQLENTHQSMDQGVLMFENQPNPLGMSAFDHI